jgi:hypothetical protein
MRTHVFLHNSGHVKSFTSTFKFGIFFSAPRMPLHTYIPQHLATGRYIKASRLRPVPDEVVFSSLHLHPGPLSEEIDELSVHQHQRGRESAVEQHAHELGCGEFVRDGQRVPECVPAGGGGCAYRGCPFGPFHHLQERTPQHKVKIIFNVVKK